MNDLSSGLPPRDHNGPPLVDPDLLKQSKDKANQFAEAGSDWLKLGEITTKEQAEGLADFISGAAKVWKRIDEARVAAKKPHDDAAKVVQSAFKPLLDVIDATKSKVQPLQRAWLVKEQARLDEEQAERRRQAEEARIAAENAAAIAAANNNIAGEVQAQAALKEAAQDEKAASKEVRAQVQSASGAGRTQSLRKLYEAEIVDINNVYRHYRDRPEVAQALKRLADADIRSKDWDGVAIPGTRTVEKDA
jgi:hypothetical protein